MWVEIVIGRSWKGLCKNFLIEWNGIVVILVLRWYFVMLLNILIDDLVCEIVLFLVGFVRFLLV